MAPRTRSNRVEKLHYQHMVTLGAPFNTVGLPALPDELLLLIVSFFPTCRIPEETRSLPENGVAPRHKTLLVLTMTCRALRRVCLPLLWQRIEARIGMEGVDNVIDTHGQHWTKKGVPFLDDKGLAREALRQLETVTIREPKYATYVNVVDLDIMSSVDTLLQELLDSLELFPRLHTTRLRTNGGLYGKELQHTNTVLSSWHPKAPLTSIKRWYSNRLVSQLMRFCPNLHTAGGLLFDFLELGHLQTMLERPMEAIERLENVTSAFHINMTDVAAKFPNLRHICLRILRDPYTPSEFPLFGQALDAFHNLDSVVFQIYGALTAGDDDSWRDRVSASSIAVLRKIQERDRRVKRFGLKGDTIDPTKEVWDLLLPLQGVPAWTESVVEVVP